MNVAQLKLALADARDNATVFFCDSTDNYLEQVNDVHIDSEGDVQLSN